MSGAIKEFIQNNKVVIAIAISVIVIGLIVIVIIVLVKRKDKVKPEAFKEPYIGTNDYTDQFKYAESYINSVIGI